MELSNLVFKVDYSQVTDAAANIKGLGTAVNTLNKPLAEMEKASSKTADAADKLAKATDNASKATKKTQDTLTKNAEILNFMTQGYSKAQAAEMNRYKLTGATINQLNELGATLKTIRTIQGGDPFDKSTSGLIALKTQLKETSFATKLYNQGFALTKEQTRELSRDMERLAIAMQSTGKSANEIALAQKNLQTEYVGLALNLNNLIRSEKEMERQHRESANAARYLANEEERIASVLSTVTLGTNVNAKTSERAAQSIALYSQRLRQAGVTGLDAAAKLEKYRASVIAIQRTEEKRKIDQLSRSLTPQISDVTVSLAGGMNPLTVLMQQGLQVRDLIAQSGVASAELQTAFRTAASDMVGSIKGTAAALGSLFVGALIDTGKAIGNMGTSIFGVNNLLDAMRNRLLAANGLMGETPKIVRVLDGAIKGLALAGGVGIFALVTAVVALGVAFKDVIKEEAELSKAITLTGAGLGFSKESALAFAEGMNGVGVSTTKAIEFLTALAKESPRVSGNLEEITRVATRLNKVAGVAFEDTAKRIEDLGSKPSDSLIKFAMESGRVEIAVLKQVEALEKSGKTTEAAKLAQDAWAKAAGEQAETIYDSLSPVEQLWMDIKSAIGGAWEQFKEWARGKDIADGFRIAWQTVAVIAAEVWYVLKATGKEIGGIAAQIAAVLTGDFAAAASIGKMMKEDAASARKEQDALIGRILGTGAAVDKQTKSYEKSAAELKANAEAARKYQEQLKKKKEPVSDEEKERLKIEKEALKLLEQTKKLTNSLTADQEQLTKAQELWMNIIDNPNFAKYPVELRAAMAAQIGLAHATELSNKAAAQEREIVNNMIEAYVKLQKARDDAAFDRLEQQDKDVQGLLDELELMQLEVDAIGLTEEARKRVIAIRQVELELAKELRDIENQDWKNNEGMKEEAKARAQEKAALKTQVINKRIAIDAAQQMQTQLSDAIETALFEGGKAGGKKLRDIITAELRKPIRVWIEATVRNITGSIFGGGSGTGGIGAPGEAAGGLGSLSSIKSAYDMVSGGLNVAGSAGQMLAKNLTNISSLGSTALTQVAGEFAGGLMSTASSSSFSSALSGTGAQMAGALVGSVMNGFSGYGISKALSGGYSTGGNTVNTLAAIASMIPGIGPIAGVVGGLVNRAFGRKAPVTTGQDLRGNFSTTGADVAQYQTNFSKGGWFRSNKTTVTRSEISSELDKYLDDSLKGITATTKNFAMILGLIPDAIDGITQSINVALLGLNSEQQQSAIAGALTGFGNKLAENLLGTYSTSTVLTGRKMVYQPTWGESDFGGGYDKNGDRRGGFGFEDVYTTITTWIAGPFVKAGETAGAALERLATSLVTVNTTFDTLSQTLLTTSLTGGDAASKLLEVFGGIEKFTAVTTAYYDAYYTEQEKVATTTRQLTAIFGNMGLTLPTTRDGFRALIEAQDLYTEEGRATYAALMNLSPAFASITTAVEQFTSSLIDEVRRLRGEIVGTAGAAGVDYLKQQFTAAQAAAAGGDANALEQLPAISQALETAAKAQATSAADIVRIQAWLAQGLSTTAGALGQPIPAFASGGMHAGGARIVGEHGPELEVTGPSRIYNANSTMGMLGGASNEMLTKLNDNITGLRAEVRADVAVNAKTAKLLDRVIPEGDSIAISGIDGGVL